MQWATLCFIVGLSIDFRTIVQYGSITLRLSAQVAGKEAKALAARLTEIRIAYARGEITMGERTAQLDAVITLWAEQFLS
jgi:hypothetical protein